MDEKQFEQDCKKLEASGRTGSVGGELKEGCQGLSGGRESATTHLQRAKTPPGQDKNKR